METELEVKQSENYNAYMRQYMKKHYANNKEKLLKYRNSLNYRKKNDVPNEIVIKYGIHLCDVMKLKELIKSIPRETLLEVLREELQEKEYKENMP